MDERLKAYDEKMQKTCEHLASDYLGIRAGRANPHVLDKLRVNYYGTPTPIQQVGNVTVPEARMIQIAPWEKSLIKEIEKAIKELGLVQIFLQTESNVPAYSFYQKNGFCELKEHISFVKQI